jgi:c(7)-type cytochrome triheme protein
LAVKYLGVFPTEEMDEIAVGKRAALPASEAFRQPLRSATTFAFVLGFVFMFGAVALSYDGIRLRPAPVSINEGVQSAEMVSAELNVPERIPIKMGPKSPGLVVFNHKQHIDIQNQTCVGCHAGKFKLLESSVDLPPMKKMNYCGECHDGVRAVGIRNTAKCTACHERK